MVNNRQLLEMRIITRSNILSGLKARRRSPSCFRHDKTTLHASVFKNEPLGVSNNIVLIHSISRPWDWLSVVLAKICMSLFLRIKSKVIFKVNTSITFKDKNTGSNGTSQGPFPLRAVFCAILSLYCIEDYKDKSRSLILDWECQIPSQRERHMLSN